MAKISFEKSSGNVFADIGFTPAEAAELTADAFQGVPWPPGERHHRPACEPAQRAWTGRRDHRRARATKVACA